MARPQFFVEQLRGHLAAIIESSDDAILSKDLHGIITSWNPAAQRLYGYTAQEAIGHPVSMLIPEGQNDELPVILDRLSRGERVDHYETVRQAKDGRRLKISLTVSPIRDDAGRIVGASAVAREIGDRERAEQELSQVRNEAEQQKRLYEAIISSTPDLVYVIDLNYRFTYANSALLTMWGLSWDEAIGKSLREIGYEPWHAEMHEREIDQVVATKQAIRGEVPFPHRELGVRNYDYIFVPILGPQGEVEAIAGTTRDVTERTQAEQRLRQLNETLEQRVAERTLEARQRADQLQRLAAELTEVEQRERRRLAQLLHDDLQQLLVAAKMRLNRQTGDDKARREVEQLLTQAIDTSRALTSDLAPPVLYDLGLNAAMEWLTRWARDRYDLNVEFQSDASVPMEDDQLRALLFAAVQELLLNVVKHANVNAARVTLDRHDGQLRVVVEDHGRGFDPVTDSTGSLSGYGLFSLHERLKLLGGQVRIDSAPGKGTCIAITVPLPPPHEAPAAPAQQTPLGDQRKSVEVTGASSAAKSRMRVLLTDDHDVVRWGLAHLIEGQPDMLIVAQAASGEEAVAMARQHRPDVVVMDITLPGISGIEATRRIMSELPQTCVIGLSMHEEQDVADAMREAGARAYFNKSQAAEKLVDGIRGLMASANGQA